MPEGGRKLVDAAPNERALALHAGAEVTVRSPASTSARGWTLVPGGSVSKLFMRGRCLQPTDQGTKERVSV